MVIFLPVKKRKLSVKMTSRWVVVKALMQRQGNAMQYMSLLNTGVKLKGTDHDFIFHFFPHMLIFL